MKIIHCADLHLDSKLETNLERSKANARRKELITAFERTVNFALQNSVKAVIIAGDMFDKERVTVNTVRTVADIIFAAKDVDFLIASGNHDAVNPFFMLDVLPPNLKFFSENWTYYNYDNVCIGGINICGKNINIIDSSLCFDADRFNIAVLHADISSEIKLNSLRHKNIDYLALGHIHKNSMDSLDARGVYAYSGCLESRGFDESGKKGFYLIDTETKKYEFVSELSVRRMFELEVDISQMTEYRDILNACENAASQAKSEDMVKFILCGSVDVNCNKNIEQLRLHFSEKFFFVKIKDKTRTVISADDYKNDISLKGEVVRSIMASGLSDEEKTSAVIYAIRAIRGEELE